MTGATRERLRRGVPEHSPDLGGWRREIVERLRHHAGDAHRGAAYRDLLPDKRGVARITSLPQTVAEDHYAIAARLILFREKVSAERRLHAENPEVRPGDAIAHDALRPVIAERRFPRSDRGPLVDRA